MLTYPGRERRAHAPGSAVACPANPGRRESGQEPPLVCAIVLPYGTFTPHLLGRASGNVAVSLDNGRAGSPLERPD